VDVERGNKVLVRSAPVQPMKPGRANAAIMTALAVALAGLATATGGCGRATTARRPPCVEKLMAIDACKQQWVIDKNKGPGDTPTWDDLRPFFPQTWSNAAPRCPAGGHYRIGTSAEPPTCSIGGPEHSIP
jgi:hypothetical protein